MIVALYILLALLVVGATLRLLHRPDDNPTEQPAAEDAEPSADSEECCGMHAVCEKDSLLTSVSTKIDYFDDEELDRFRGRAASDYTPSEEEEFRNVLLTLLPDDVAPWARSVALRGIQLPLSVRDELLMIVGEKRSINV